MEINKLKDYILSFEFTKLLTDLSYLDLDHQKKRFLKLIDDYKSDFNNQEVSVFSVSGRTEIIGNHTDHQHGHVLAAAISQDLIALVSKDTTTINIISPGFKIPLIKVSNISRDLSEDFTSQALIKGVLTRFKELGYKVGGFNCLIDSEVLKGSGMSSSAAFTVLIGTIINELYNEGKVDFVEIAEIAKYAENHYFNKPSGLMDQLSVAAGGFVYLDFNDPLKPKVEKLDFDLALHNYQILLVDTKGDHANLSNEYDDIVTEMQEVANYFNVEYLRDVKEKEFINNISNLRKVTSERAILRALHFFNEQKRVLNTKNALLNNDIKTFLKEIKLSGDSSFKYLQNVYVTKKPLEQPLSLALALADYLLEDDESYRVHGGGFAGTILLIVKNENVLKIKEYFENIFLENSVIALKIRNQKASCIIK